jgi:HAD superfamily hydrolase (TIGR01509 family)
LVGDAVDPFALVIFDCDGVLVDTEPTATRVLVAMLATVGIAMTEAEVLRAFVGRSAAASLTIIAERLGAPLAATFLEDWHDRLFAEFRRGVAPIPGVAAVLDALAADGRPTCVASSGGHDRMRVTLGASGLLPRFEGRLFSATEVARGKPFPDVFLHAAARMGAEPLRTAVVEDSVAGVTAAVAAGMTVFGYTAGEHSDPAELAAAGARPFGAMHELPVLLRLRDSRSATL